jgi:hypothetical protein
MVYFAAGRDVFRMPYLTPMNIRNVPDALRKNLPQRPDPSEPEGCPENPVVGMGFSIGYKYEPRHPENYGADVSFTVEQLSIIATSPGYYGMQPLYERFFESKKNTYNICEEYSNGLVGCRTPTKDKTIPKKEWAVTFQAKSEIYRAPLGRPFVVHCLPYGLGSQQCSVSFNYTDYLRIRYRFHLAKFPILEIIEFDKGLREKLELMRLRDYPWPE